MNMFTRVALIALLGLGFASQGALAQDLTGAPVISLAPVDLMVRFVAAPLKANALQPPMKLLTPAADVPAIVLIPSRN